MGGRDADEPADNEGCQEGEVAFASSPSSPVTAGDITADRGSSQSSGTMPSGKKRPKPSPVPMMFPRLCSPKYVGIEGDGDLSESSSSSHPALKRQISSKSNYAKKKVPNKAVDNKSLQHSSDGMDSRSAKKQKSSPAAKGDNDESCPTQEPNPKKKTFTGKTAGLFKIKYAQDKQDIHDEKQKVEDMERKARDFFTELDGQMKDVKGISLTLQGYKTLGEGLQKFVLGDSADDESASDLDPDAEHMCTSDDEDDDDDNEDDEDFESCSSESSDSLSIVSSCDDEDDASDSFPSTSDLDQCEEGNEEEG